MIDEATEAQLYEAMKMCLRASREGIHITIRGDDMKVMIGVPIGETVPKWLTNALMGLSNRITIAAMSAVCHAAVAFELNRTEPTPEPSRPEPTFEPAPVPVDPKLKLN